MAIFNNNLLAGAGAQSSDSTYKIGQSIRFNDDDNAYLSRTLSTASDGGKTYTFSWWQKLGSKINDSSIQYIIHTDLSGGNPANYFYFNNDNFQFWGQPTGVYLRTDREFRDPSAWYHFVFVHDSTQAIASERLRLYVNGIRETSFSTENYPALNSSGYFNTNTAHYIGGGTGTSNRLDAYMAEIHFLDGLGYDPSFFGEFNSSGIWIPKEYTGSYGSNGFKIDGRDASNLGDDESGNGNDFTSNNLAASDQVLDSPTNNFATFNPVMTNDSDFEFSQGNLTLDMNTNKSWYVGAGASISVSSGKWYWESYWNGGDSYTIWGILDTEQLHALAGSGSTTIYSLNFQGIQPNASGSNDIYGGGSGATIGNTGQAASPGGIWQFALDLDNNKMWLGYNGTYVGSGDPAGGTNELWGPSYITSSSYTPINLGYQISAHSVLTYNFGQDSTFAGVTTAGGNADSAGIGNFKYSVPSGFKALCTKNLGS